MQNRFGLKDLFVTVMLLAVGLSVWLSMVQNDKHWTRMKEVEDRIKGLEQALSRQQLTLDSANFQGLNERTLTTQERLDEVIRTLESGIAVRGTPGGTAPATTPNSTGPASQSPADWARPGVEITRSAPFAFVSDPRKVEGVSEAGTFEWTFEAQPPTLTPYRYADTYGRYINDLVVESLGRYNPATLQIEGQLAEAWQMDPEGRWLRVLIQRRARFSDGTPVTAEDVRYTFQDLLSNPQIEADRFRAVYKAIESVKVISDKAVEFTFATPRFDNFTSAMRLPIVPSHFYKTLTPQQFNQSTALLLGSGPYKLDRLDPENQWKPPEDIVLVRNDLYWGPRPVLPRLRVKTISDSLARLTTFTNGLSDMIRPTAQQLALKLEDESFKQYAQAHTWYNMQGGWSFIAWQNGPRAGKALTPFSDGRVRRAMTHLIDRDLIVRDIFKNLARVGNGPFNTETQQANPDIKPWPYDLAKARELLREAGWVDRNNDGVLDNEKGDRFVFQLTFAQGNDSTLQMVTYVKDQCAKVGIVCELNPIDWSILDGLLKARDFDAITFAWSSSAPESDPRQLFHSESIAGTGDNFVQWNNPKADVLIDQGVQTIDFDARMRIWHQLHTLIHEEQPYTPLLELPWYRFVNKRVGNFNAYKAGMEVPEFFVNPGASRQP